MVDLQLLYEVAIDLVYVDCVDLTLDDLEVLVFAEQFRAVNGDDSVIEFGKCFVDGVFVDIALFYHFVNVLVGPEEVI